MPRASRGSQPSRLASKSKHTAGCPTLGLRGWFLGSPKTPGPQTPNLKLRTQNLKLRRSVSPPCPTTVLRYCLVILPTQLSYRCALRKCAMPMPVHNYSRPRRRAHCSAIPPAFSAIYRLCFGISTNRGAHISFVLTDSQKTRGVSSTHVHSSQCRRTSFFDGHLRLADPLQILPSPQSIPTRHSLAPSFEGRPLSQRRCLVTPLFPLDTKIGGGGPYCDDCHVFPLTSFLATHTEKKGGRGSN